MKHMVKDFESNYKQAKKSAEVATEMVESLRQMQR